MSVYLQIDIEIVDMPTFQTYIARIPELIGRHGGRYLVKGVTPIVVESQDTAPSRSVLLEFPSRANVDAFLAERHASGLLDTWTASTRARILLLEGIEP
ncbi:MAG: hypothetical protein CMD83_18610 [Gammaproteobacteria bacterium]|nr:hypothetical protein [Gammaproteobacteria bacterium]